MPTTPRLGLVYPALADDPDVPDDLRKLALSVEDAAIGWNVGDFKFSFQSADHDQFIKCDGTARFRAGLPAAYLAMIDSILGIHPDPTRVFTPNLRRRSPMGADPGGATIAGVAPNLGAIAGEEAHTLLAAESGVNSNGSTTSNGLHSHNATARVSNTLDPPDGSTGRTGFAGAVQDTQFVFVDADGAHAHAFNARNADNPHNNIGPVLFGHWFIATGGGGSGTGGGGGGTSSGVGGLVSLPAGVRHNVIHDLATNFITITVWDVATGLQTDAEPKIEDVNTISLLSAAARDVNVAIIPAGLPLL